MRAVYRQPARVRARLACAARASAGLALAALLSVACHRGPGATGDGGAAAAAAPAMLQPARIELADLLASEATAVDSSAAARRLAAQGLAWSTEPPPTPLRTLLTPPAGFRIAALTPRGDRVAFVREVDPDTTEVLLHDRATLETRLLLPIDHDARFLPQRFSTDGSQLFLFTDEGDDTLQLEILELASGRRERRARPGCEAQRLDVAADGAVYALQWSCAGAIEAALFETASGAELAPLPLPAGTRLARALPASGSGGALYEVASAHFPRDLMFADRLDPDAGARPLSFGLAPAVTAEDLVDPSPVKLRIAGAPPVPAELWWPRRPSVQPPAVIWLEADSQPPTWLEFHPFLQFLANRGVAVLRLRPRGSQGFGKRFRHAADGRIVDSGLEDVDAARAELLQRGADPLRLAIVGAGPWTGALAALALGERSGRFAAAADLAGDPDPLAQIDLVPTLAEPLRAWWTARLGEPLSEAARRNRMRMLLPANPPAGQLLVAADPAAAADVPAAFAALWEFLRASLGAPP